MGRIRLTNQRVINMLDTLSEDMIYLKGMFRNCNLTSDSIEEFERRLRYIEQKFNSFVERFSADYAQDNFCPKCGIKLVPLGNTILTSNPPQFPYYCPECDYRTSFFE